MGKKRVRWFTTEERWEKHPIVLLINEFGKMTFAELWNVLSYKRPAFFKITDMSAEDQENLRRRQWLDTKLQQKMIPMETAIFDEPGKLNWNLNQLRKRHIIRREPENNKESRIGTYFYVPAYERAKDDLLTKWIDPSIVMNHYSGDKIGITYKTWARGKEPRSEYHWTADRFGIPDGSHEYPLVLPNLLWVDSLGGVTSSSFPTPEEKIAEFRQINAEYIQKLLNLYLPQLKEQLILTLEKEIADPVKKKTIQEILENKNFMITLTAQGWRIILPYDDPETEDIVNFLTKKLKFPAIVTLLSPIPNESQDGTVRCAWF